MNANLNFKNKEIIYQLLLIMIIVFLYSFSWSYPIYDSWDDTVYILKNNHLAFSFSNILWWFTHPCVGCYLPITMLSYMFDYSLWGLNSFGYHLQNIFWHIVTVIVIYKCFRFFEIKSWIAFFLCLIFAAHPQRVESVVWLSERKDVLCAAFYFISIYFYIKNYNKKFSITAFVCFILSLLSKPMALSLPVILLIYEFYRRNQCRIETIDRGQKSEVRSQESVTEGEKTEIGEKETVDNCQLTVDGKQKKKPNPQEPKQIRSIRVISGFIKLWLYFLVLFIFIPITIIAQGEATVPNNSILSFHKLYTVLYNIYWYTTQTLLPTDLNPIHPLIAPFNTIMEVLLFYIGAFSLAIISFIKKKRFFIFNILPLILVYLIALLPVIGVVRLGSIDHADRYSYIPSVFIWFSIGLILTRILYKNISTSSFQSPVRRCLNKKFIIAILIFYTAILLFFNYQYQEKWKNVHILFNYAASCVPVNSAALIGLGDIELNNGNYGEVLIIAEKLKSKDRLIATFFEASVLFNVDRKSAVKLLLKIKPLLKDSYNFNDYHNRYISLLGMLTIYYNSIGNTQKAIEYNNEILSQPNLCAFMRFFCRGLNEYYLKNYRKALVQFRKALALKPDDKAVLKYIDMCLLLATNYTIPKPK